MPDPEGGKGAAEEECAGRDSGEKDSDEADAAQKVCFGVLGRVRGEREGGKGVEGFSDHDCHERGHRGSTDSSKNGREEDGGVAPLGEGEEEAERGLRGDVGDAGGARGRGLLDREVEVGVVGFLVHAGGESRGLEGGGERGESCNMRLGVVNIVGGEDGLAGGWDVDGEGRSARHVDDALAVAGEESESESAGRGRRRGKKRWVWMETNRAPD
jgi:hypothetical protein